MLGNTTEILFDKFEIIEVLKKDEHAAVFLANHIYLSKKIILKVLNTQKISDQALVERFKREAKLLAKLDHPNIIKVLDFGMSKEYFYISFEYIDGDSLRNVFKTKTLSLEEKKHLTVQLLQALSFAHSNNIIHRDIKPENIFVDKNLNLKLGDFGLALSTEDSFVTNPYSIVGTPSYMSPEQVRGAKLTPQSDLFSAGVVIHELYTGKNPFLRDNVSLTLNEIMSYQEDKLKINPEDQPKEIVDILFHLLRRKPEQRYNSAIDVLKDLNISPEQIAATLRTNEKKEKSNRVKIFTAFAAIAVILVAIIILQFIDKQNGHLSSSDETQQTSSQFAEEKTANKPNEISNDLESSPIDIANLDKPLVEETQKDNNTNETRVVRSGALFVQTYPFADVFVDGEKIDTTPMSKPLVLAEGEHTIKLVHSDYPVYSDVIRIEAGKVKNVSISLESLMGFIECKVYPWGDVYINGDYKGQTPIQLIRVAPGFIRMSIKNSNFTDIDTSFNIKRGDTLKFRFSLKK